jgi:regulator of replication initiation timing
MPIEETTYKVARNVVLDYITNLQQEVRINNDLIPYFKNKQKELKKEITNLQQENERLKELDENYPIEEELAEAYRREEDYKSRIEKAVEWLITKADRRSLHELIDILNGKE